MSSITLNYEPGSYRDRDGRVFYDASGTVCRALSTSAWNEWNVVRDTQFFRQALADQQVIFTQEHLAEPLVLQAVAGGWAGVLQHASIPFVSYPYEWSFGMLQDAALLHLDLLSAAIEEDVILKDGTAYNIQWMGARPVFIDIASFERLAAGQAWAGYRQFCQTFLYPLLLQSYKNIPFHPWLRGALDGITPQECRNLMSVRDFFRSGVAAHVYLHSWLQSRPAIDRVDTPRALSSAGFHKDLIRNNVRGLRKVIQRLRWSPTASTWSDYSDSNSYSTDDRQAKDDFVRQTIHSRRWELVWDVGCNTGTYARIAAENAQQVVAMDADHQAVEKLYQQLKSDAVTGGGNILPLVNNLVDPSVGLGWRGIERKALVDRGRPDLVLCLALVHHLVIGHGVPLRELLASFAELGTSLVIEFVTKQDPMVQKLLRGRRDNYDDYEIDVFERLLNEMFDVVRSEPLQSGTRTLYFAEPRSVS